MTIDGFDLSAVPNLSEKEAAERLEETKAITNFFPPRSGTFFLSDWT